MNKYMAGLITVTAWIEAARSHKADILLGALSLALGAVALIGYGYASDGTLRALLWPHAKITGAFFHIKLPYQNGVGYVAAGRGFAIGPDCMGARFTIMLFCMSVCVFTWRVRGAYKLAFFILSLIGSAIAGAIANSARIIGSVPIIPSGQFAAIHAGTGVVIYLVTLAAIYILIDRITRSKCKRTQR